jgi:hypothetical protein
MPQTGSFALISGKATFPFSAPANPEWNPRTMYALNCYIKRKLATYAYNGEGLTENSDDQR